MSAQRSVCTSFWFLLWVGNVAPVAQNVRVNLNENFYDHTWFCMEVPRNHQISLDTINVTLALLETWLKFLANSEMLCETMANLDWGLPENPKLLGLGVLLWKLLPTPLTGVLGNVDVLLIFHMEAMERNKNTKLIDFENVLVFIARIKSYFKRRKIPSCFPRGH